MQANLPIHRYSIRCHRPQPTTKLDVSVLYASDHDRWSKRTLAHARSRLRYFKRLAVWLDPEDVNQNVWMAAWEHYEKLHQYPDERRLSWLITATSRKAIDAQRHAGRRKRRPVCADIQGPWTRSVDLDRLPCEAARTPCALASGVELCGVIDQKISTLPSEGQEVIRLRFWEGYDYSMIARHTGRSTGACASLLRKSKWQIRSEFSGSLLVDLDETYLSGELRRS